MIVANSMALKVTTLANSKNTVTTNALVTTNSMAAQKSQLLKVFAQNQENEYDFAALGDRLSSAASSIAGILDASA